MSGPAVRLGRSQPHDTARQPLAQARIQRAVPSRYPCTVCSTPLAVGTSSWRWPAKVWSDQLSTAGQSRDARGGRRRGAALGRQGLPNSQRPSNGYMLKRFDVEGTHIQQLTRRVRVFFLVFEDYHSRFFLRIFDHLSARMGLRQSGVLLPCLPHAMQCNATSPKRDAGHACFFNWHTYTTVACFFDARSKTRFGWDRLGRAWACAIDKD